MNPRVSVIIPVYNSENFLKESIKSILDQTYRNLEIIILDDCSKDNSLEIIRELAKQDHRIKVIANERNLNIAENRNKGVLNSSGEFVVWQDSDDISYPDRIAILVDFMLRNKEVGICGSYMESFDGTNITDIRKYPTQDYQLRSVIFKYSPVAQPTAIVRRECFDKVGFFDKSLPPAEDLDLTFRIGQYYKLANIPKVLLKYREHPNSATFKKMRTIINNTLKVRKKYSKGHGYTMSFTDRIIYIFTWCIQFLNPRIILIIFKIYKRFFMRYRVLI